MYIPAFWVGVGVTIAVEISLIFTAAVICAINNKKNDGDGEGK